MTTQFGNWIIQSFFSRIQKYSNFSKIKFTSIFRQKIYEQAQFLGIFSRIFPAKIR